MPPVGQQPEKIKAETADQPAEKAAKDFATQAIYEISGESAAIQGGLLEKMQKRPEFKKIAKGLTLLSVFAACSIAKVDFENKTVSPSTAEAGGRGYGGRGHGQNPFYTHDGGYPGGGGYGYGYGHGGSTERQLKRAGIGAVVNIITAVGAGAADGCYEGVRDKVKRVLGGGLTPGERSHLEHARIEAMRSAEIAIARAATIDAQKRQQVKDMFLSEVAKAKNQEDIKFARIKMDVALQFLQAEQNPQSRMMDNMEQDLRGGR